MPLSEQSCLERDLRTKHMYKMANSQIGTTLEKRDVSSWPKLSGSPGLALT
jgi:hypothetical protein